MVLQALAFYVFAAVVIFSGGGVVLSRNPVYSVLWLILAFFNAAAAEGIRDTRRSPGHVSRGTPTLMRRV